MIILCRFRFHVGRRNRCVSCDKIGKAAGKAVLCFQFHHRLIAILPQLQLTLSVDTEKPTKNLPHIVEHIPVGLNIILRINGKQLCSIGHRFIVCLALCHLHLTGLTTQAHKIIHRADGFKAIEAFIKPEHKIIGFQLQRLDITVSLRHLKDSHWHLFKAAIRQS